MSSYAAWSSAATRNGAPFARRSDEPQGAAWDPRTNGTAALRAVWRRSGGGAANAATRPHRRARRSRRSGRVILFLGELCNISFPVEQRPLLIAAQQDPKIMQLRVRQAFVDWLRAGVDSPRCSLIIDDLQWGMR